MRLVLGLLVVLIVILGGVLVIGGPSLSKGASSWMPSFDSTPTGTKVRMADVTTQPLIETVAAPGEIIPNVKVDISAEVSARILELPYREGDRVEKGQVVVRLDDREYRASLESSMARRDAERYRLESERSRIEGPMASLENAKANLERQEALFRTGDVSKQVLDDAVARVRDLEASVAASRHNISVSESSVAAAEADIARAARAVDKCVISAPMDGLVTRLNAEVGELVVVGTMNNAGTVIMTIGDLSMVKLNAKVNEADIARVRRDQPATVRINAYRDEIFTGRVHQVALQRTDDRDGTGYFKVEINIDPKEGRQILSGLAANVDIEIEAHSGLVIPSQAILDRPTDELPAEVAKDNPLVDRSRRTTSIVFRDVDGRATLTPVRSGPSSLTDTMVVAGLKEGDVVLTGPFKVLEKLKHGERVERENEVRDEPTGALEATETVAHSGS